MWTKARVFAWLALFSVAAGPAVAVPGQESAEAAPARQPTPESTAPASAPPASGAQRWALLVGIDDYAELEDLQHPSHALKQLQVRLTAAGFPVTNVFVLSDAAKMAKYLPSKANIERQVQLVSSLPGSDDLLMVVLCGRVLHLDGKSYLCPLDASRQDVAKTMVDLDFILQQTSASAARHKLLILDPVAATNDETTSPVEPLLEAWQSPPSGVAVWFSCGRGQSSLVDASRNGTVFLRCVAQGFDGGADQRGDKDGRISWGELTDYARDETVRHASSSGGKQQTPVLSGQVPREVDLGRVAQYAAVQAAYPVIEDDPGAASARLEALSRINPLSLRALNQASAAYGHGDLIEAVNLTTDALQYDRGNLWAHILRASAHAAYGNLAKAVDDYRELGIPLPCFVAVERAELRQGNEVVAKVQQGDKVYATKAEGELLFVQVYQADGVKQGWIHQDKLE